MIALMWTSVSLFASMGGGKGRGGLKLSERDMIIFSNPATAELSRESGDVSPSRPALRHFGHHLETRSGETLGFWRE